MIQDGCQPRQRSGQGRAGAFRCADGTAAAALHQEQPNASATHGLKPPSFGHQQAVTPQRFSPAQHVAPPQLRVSPPQHIPPPRLHVSPPQHIPPPHLPASSSQLFASVPGGEVWNAAKAGDAAKQVELGMRFLDGNGMPRDQVQAANWIRMAADQGFAEGQRLMGMMYLQGIGVQQDPSQALMWTKMAALQGDQLAMNALGVLHQKKHELKKAEDWFTKAAQLGLVIAMRNLGSLLLHNYAVPAMTKAGPRWLKKAAEKGDCTSQCFLGTLYEQGTRTNVPKDEAEAIRWYTMAAAGPEAEGGKVAKEQLEALEAARQEKRKGRDKGSARKESPRRERRRSRSRSPNGGRKRSRSPSRAVPMGGKGRARISPPGETSHDFIHEAVVVGRREAQFAYAYALETGTRGVKRDPRKALLWYYKAGKQGQVRACARLGNSWMRPSMALGHKSNLNKAVEWFLLGAKGGHRDSMVQLARCYRSLMDKSAVNRQYHTEQAIRWFRRAALLGDKRGIRGMSGFILNGKGFKKDVQLANELHAMADQKFSSKMLAQKVVGMLSRAQPEAKE